MPIDRALWKAHPRRMEMYDLYWWFAAERQKIFFRRLEGKEPWTADPVLKKHRFTNAYRASDRVSQFLIRQVIYNDAYPASANEVVFRILLFKFFNKISTWQILAAQLGLLTWQSFSRDAYDQVLSATVASGKRIYSAAYVIPPVALPGATAKHRGHLALLDLIMRGDFVSQAEQTRNLGELFQLLRGYPSLGNFLAFQLSVDLNYSPIVNHSEDSFVMAGPGAKDGISKVFPSASASGCEDLIARMMDAQEAEFDRLGLEFRSLWGRRLQLIDCQNLFCELSKYTRASHPHILGVSGRTRIKQAYRPEQAPVQPWYPPKWGINEQIPSYRSANGPQLLESAQ